jgi:hypothetical protein
VTNDRVRRAKVVLQEIGGALERQDELRAWAQKVQGLPAPQPGPKPGPQRNP